jgi:hypothetical protein
MASRQLERTGDAGTTAAVVAGFTGGLLATRWVVGIIADDEGCFSAGALVHKLHA